MKKTYIIPEALTVSLSATHIIAASDGTLSQSGDNLTGSVIDENASGSGLAKGNKSVWDNEW